MSGDMTCPKCDGIGCFPGLDVDDTAITITCDLCQGRCEVGREEWLDWCADQFADPMPRGFSRRYGR